ncbi:MAG: carboxypeptidase regulatory-like domain-containing protein [Acidobacteriia bacterium]|nr:carboxypeptidase regulatory-like domain-containing protein [Terriglobia bacterium]
MKFSHVLLLSILSLGILMIPSIANAQTTNAVVTGRITDPSKAVIVDAHVTVINTATGVHYEGKTNGAGSYVVPSLPPGPYRAEIEKPGFRTIVETGLVLHVQDTVELNFEMVLGAVSESMTITASAYNINTTDGNVSTVIDRKFVENMPLNGRSFQDLLTLTPGVTVVSSTYGPGASGEISVNGQRTEANYFTVDGVSANTGTTPSTGILGLGFSGGTPGETVLGTTQSMVSIDALQEFRASTSTYSAEYGRTPGGQFSLTTRSGTNAWHGSAYDYFRNDAMDANNWFNKCGCLYLPLTPRLPERQNDFGGTLGGPIRIPGLYNGKDKTFFFISYEGLRLTVPQPSHQYFVPDMTMRQQAPAAVQPFLNAFSVPNGGEDGLNDGLAIYNLAYSAPSSLDNVGVRVDHSFGDKLKLFGRYANTPSSGWTFLNPAFKRNGSINVRTLTVGATSTITPRQANELRFNITQNNSINNVASTNFGGATPFDISSLPGPNGQPPTAVGTAVIFALGFGGFSDWSISENTNSQRQYNVTDTHSWSHGAYQVKFGVDWRRLTTYVRPITNNQLLWFNSEASVLANSADFVSVLSNTSVPVEPVYHNFSAFVQDDWKALPRLSLSLGLRWDVNPAPGNLNGPSPYTVDQITNLSTTKLAPENTPLWKTDWHGFAPRVGLAYQLRQAPGYETVLRTGFGLFYDTGNVLGSVGFSNAIGFTSSSLFFGVPVPLTSAQVTLPPPRVAAPYNATVYAFDPNLKLPYTMEWNFAVEQGLGANQTLTMSYVGSAARRLLATFNYNPTDNPNFSLGNGLAVTSNRASSDYNALQVKYQKNLSHGLQALASYTWSHSIDDASSNFGLTDELLRSSSNFDIRHNFQAAITYDVPGNYSNPLASAVLTHWGLDTRISVRSALPVDVLGAYALNPVTHQNEYFHPDLVPGQPIYLYGSQYPGGRIINYNAFTAAPTGVDGNVGRNFARGFGATQVSLSLRRDFPIHDRLHLQFRAEAFNVVNHANFGSIYNFVGYGPSLFGYAYNTLNNSLGGLNPLYQSGGPRSLQLALKLVF